MLTEMATAVSLDSYKVKDVTSWSTQNILEFVEEVLPGHPCVNSFKYTTGFVLASLTKEDIRRQSKDEEAANVIWAELQRFRSGIAEKKVIEEACPSVYTVFVRTPSEVAMEFEVAPTETIMALKIRLADVEGTPVENQRLVWNGINTLNQRTLASYNINHGAVILLVPHLAATQRFVPPPAPRGLLMIPGNRAWQPAHTARPYMPVVCSDIYRPFPMSLEFESVPDYKTFVMAAQKQVSRPDATVKEGYENLTSAVVLEILPVDNSHEPVQTRVYLDNDVEMIRVDTLGDVVVPNTRYNAVIHMEREQKRAFLTTGNRIG